MSHEVYFSSLSPWEPGQISMCTIRGREVGTQLASSGHSGRGAKFQESEGQCWRRQEHRPRDSVSEYKLHLFFLLFAFPFCLFYGPQASSKGSFGLKLQHIINNGGKGGMLTRAKFRVCCLACDKPENNCEMPALPYSSNVNELLSNKRPPKALILLSLSPGRRQNWTESMLDWLLPEFIQLWKILVYNNPGWGML